MVTTTRKIEVEEATAAALERRAAEQGVSVSDLLSDLAELFGTPVSVDAAGIEELDRRWAAAKSDPDTVPHADVVRWLKTWGTPVFKPWHEQ
jgi:Putative addiction module component